MSFPKLSGRLCKQSQCWRKSSTRFSRSPKSSGNVEIAVDCIRSSLSFTRPLIDLGSLVNVWQSFSTIFSKLWSPENESGNAERPVAPSAENSSRALRFPKFSGSFVILLHLFIEKIFRLDKLTISSGRLLRFPHSFKVKYSSCVTCPRDSGSSFKFLHPWRSSFLKYSRSMMSRGIFSNSTQSRRSRTRNSLGACIESCL